MRRPEAALVACALAVCGGGTAAPRLDAAVVVVVRPPDAAVAPPDAAVAPPDAEPWPPSPACIEAKRDSLGPLARCVEELLVDAPKGQLVRVWDRDDAFAKSLLVVVTADGVAHADWTHAPIELLLPASDPAIQAQICAANDGAVVRCLPGDAHALPEGYACTPPRRIGGSVEAIVETSYGLMEHEPFAPTLWQLRWGRDCRREGGNATYDDPDLAPLPRLAWMAPPPFAPVSLMVPPPLGDRICEAARRRLGADIRCQAFGFPGLDTSLGSIFYVSTDAGRDEVLVRRYPDGFLVAGESREVFEDLWAPLLAQARAGTLPPESLVRLRLLAAHIEASVSGPYAVREDPQDGFSVTLTIDLRRTGAPWASTPARGRNEVSVDDGGGVMVDHGPH